MSENLDNIHKKSKNTNIFLNNKINESKQNYNNNNANKLRTNLFSNQIGKNTLTNNQDKREIDINNDELFPTLTQESVYISKKSKTKTSDDYISYLSIAKQEKSIKKETTYEVDPGWVHLFKSEDNKIHFLYGPTTEKCLELEKKEYELKIKKERNELYKYIEDIEYERNLRKELYKDICNFYDPNKDKYYTKEEDIIIYTSNDLSDSDTEGSYDYHDNDYDNANNAFD